VQRVCDTGVRLRLAVRAVRASRWPGPSGNVEYFIWFTPAPTTSAPVEGQEQGAGTIDLESALDVAATTDATQIESAVRVAVEEGPT
jgi:23S rRNA (cytidine1920-2'-O)/16S rRNA (cytidine1409-2'-O)-methyltransferase